jgi:hypothetical protein
MLAGRAWLVSGLPLMHPTFYIRLARAEEAAALSGLRSKVVWGYDPEFMALMPTALEVVPEHIAAGDPFAMAAGREATAFDDRDLMRHVGVHRVMPDRVDARLRHDFTGLVSLRHIRPPD